MVTVKDTDYGLESGFLFVLGPKVLNDEEPGPI